jgi:hypothetical protein
VRDTETIVKDGGLALCGAAFLLPVVSFWGLVFSKNPALMPVISN